MNTNEFILSRRTGFIVYGWLIGLTIIEVLIVRSGLPNLAGAIIMGATTVSKILMVALFFMHMKHDRALAWLLPLIPIALAIFFVLALFPDLVYHLPLRY